MASRYQATDPEGYERIMGRFSNRLAPSFVTFAGSSAGERVLDVGCGTGRTVAALAAQGNHAAIAAIDVSETYVEYAKARNSDPRISFQVADAGDLPFEDNSFDRAVCQLVLQFMPDPGPAVLEMRRVVRPGGVVAACVWDSFGALPPMRVVWDVAVGLGLSEEPRLVRPLGSPGELSTMWSAAGFEEVEEDVLTVRFQYDDFSDFWNSFENGDGPIRQFIGALSQAGRETLKKKLEVAFLSGAGDGPRSFLAGALACRGVVPIL
jgi:SAM-dependent methyltransferase